MGLLSSVVGGFASKYVLFGAVGVASIMLGLGYFYVRHTQGRIEDLTRKNAQLEIQVAEYRDAVKELQDNFVLFKQSLEDLYSAMVDAGIPEQKVLEFLSSIDISEVKPEDLQAIINSHQVDIDRCFEIVSGGSKNDGNKVCPNF